MLAQSSFAERQRCICCGESLDAGPGAASQIQVEVGGGAAGEVLEVAHEPGLGLGAADVAQVGEEFPVGVEPCMKSSAAIEWISMRFMVPGLTWPSSISRVTKAMARISRMREELKEISLTRFRISVAVFGTSGRASGLMCTTITSLDWQS